MTLDSNPEKQAGKNFLIPIVKTKICAQVPTDKILSHSYIREISAVLLI